MKDSLEDVQTLYKGHTYCDASRIVGYGLGNFSLVELGKSGGLR